MESERRIFLCAVLVLMICCDGRLLIFCLIESSHFAQISIVRPIMHEEVSHFRYLFLINNYIIYIIMSTTSVLRFSHRPIIIILNAFHKQT